MSKVFSCRNLSAIFVSTAISWSSSSCAQSGLQLIDASADSAAADPLAINSAILRSRAVKVDFDILTLLTPSQSGTVLPLPVELRFFEDSAMTVMFDWVEPRWPTEFTGLPIESAGFIGHGTILEDGGSVCMVTESGKACLIYAHSHNGPIFALEPVGDEHFSRELDATVDGECAAETEDDEVSEEQDGGGGSVGELGEALESATCDTGTIIDLIVFGHRQPDRPLLR
jgi:hypothetical protein